MKKQLEDIYKLIDDVMINARNLKDKQYGLTHLLVLTEIFQGNVEDFRINVLNETVREPTEYEL